MENWAVENKSHERNIWEKDLKLCLYEMDAKTGHYNGNRFTSVIGIGDGEE